MSRFIWLFPLLLLALLFSAGAPATTAQSSGAYIWEVYAPTFPSGANPALTAQLEDEVRRVLANGHLRPFRAIYGEDVSHFYWYQPFDSVYTLMLAYPFLPDTLQTEVGAYVRTEMQQRPLWNASYLDPTEGAFRQPEGTSEALFEYEAGEMLAQYQNRPRLFALYALWLYAYRTGDWQYVDSNWTQIKAFYNGYRSESGHFYSSIAGAIGYARLAQQKAVPDSTAVSAALTDIENGLALGRNVTSFGDQAVNAYQFITGWMPEPGWAPTAVHSYMGHLWLNMTPEIGRYIRENSAHKAAALGLSPAEERYTLARAEYLHPLWYMARAPMWNKIYGEGSGISPDTKAMVFPLKAWIQQVPANQLRLYLDVPDALVGDFYFMQNLARTIEAYGQDCWENLQTQAVECPGTLAPDVLR